MLLFHLKILEKYHWGTKNGLETGTPKGMLLVNARADFIDFDMMSWFLHEKKCVQAKNSKLVKLDVHKL